MKLIVGLGNPGKEYSNTRHNIGFIILDNYLKGEKWLTKSNYEYLEKIVLGEKIIFVKPLTYMNLSGVAVKQLIDYYKIDPSDLLVIRDDMDIESMKYRFKFSSSSGGHNGIKNIIEKVGTDNFSQLKVGISRKENVPVIDYVLGKLNKDELAFLKSKVFCDMIDDYISKGINYVMNAYNSME